ncbi:MAG: dihydroorotate dehydrogenase [Oscillospiraceae bacterium]
MSKLAFDLCMINFKNPIIAASGTFGFGREYEKFYKLSTLGGISVKGLTLHKRDGNLSPRIDETYSGILNSVGLQNPGVFDFVKNELPYLRTKDTVIIANLSGSKVEDYVEAAEVLSNSDVDIIELNISCPNVKEGGMAFSVSCESAYGITKAVKNICKKPLMVKLSPNVTDISSIAKSVEDAGADAISLINTITAMKINIDSRRPVLRNNFGGVSGPCVFPIALRMVYQVSNSVKIPVVGMGGISSYEDVIQMLMAGASCVQIGTMFFNDPYIHIKILEDIEGYLNRNNIKNIKDLVGAVEIFND